MGTLGIARRGAQRSSENVASAARNLPAIVLVLGTLANLLPLWIPQAVGSMDGPIHMGAAMDLLHWLGDPSSPARAYLEPLPFPVPNLTPEVLYAALLGVLPATLAERVFLTGYVIGFTLAFRYAVRSVEPRAAWLTVFAIPLTLSVAFAFGLFNYVWSLVPFLVTIGYALRYKDDLRGRHAVVVGVLAALTYLTHLVSFVEVVILIGSVVGTGTLRAMRARRGEGRSVLEPIRALGPLALALAPTAIVAAIFLVGNGAAGSNYRRSLLTLIGGLPSLAWPLVSFERSEIVFTSFMGLVLGLFVLLAFIARRRGFGRRDVDGLLVGSVIATVAYLAAPEATGSGGLISERLALYPPIAVVLWLASQRLPDWSPRVAAVSIAVVMTGLLALRAPAYAAMGRDVADYLQIAPCMARDATFVQANLWYDVPSPLGRSFALLHDGGRLAAATGGLDLGSVTATLPLYPLQYRSDIDPFTTGLITRQNGEYEIPPGIAPLTYEERTTGRVDYVVLFGRIQAAPGDLADPAWQDVQAQLDDGYRLVARSPSGLTELYERTTSPLAAAGADRRAQPAAVACAIR